ncbi:hypothetical protein PAHAL_5G267200 [Panicum hallii]|uniref:At1g61320/AtMIF1 LRR domain-containing protein n=1 Tax=Panicum hallii TaxID=206008 RepID=A0A2T8ILC7_9POAL|nr:hypothetical protein PAHAL_5G267200 [Panicum hallii]
MQAAARAGCASRQLLRSWRHYPELEFSARTVPLDGRHTCARGQVAKDVIRRIDAAPQNRTGICVKRLRFELQFLRKVRAGTINRWLDAAATLGVHELTLDLPLGDAKLRYRFPCELFFDENGCSIQSLRLSACSFSPGHGSCSFGSLRRVGFSWVRITTEESWLFLSNSPALERLELEYCHEIACLRIPSTLQLLSSLRVRHCKVLQSVETDAPNLSIFHYQGPIIQFSLGEALHLKDVNMSIYPCFNLFDYVLKELPKLGPDLETLSLMSADEIGYMYPLKIVLREEFTHLKHLELGIVEESPVKMRLADIDPSKPVKLPRLVKATGFCPVQDLVELSNYILNTVASQQSALNLVPLNV